MDTVSDKTDQRYSPLRDKSLLALLAANAVAAILGVLLEWNVIELMAVYWAQSVVIGIVNYKRMIGLKEFSTKNLRMNNRPVPETQEAKRGVAKFFSVHYGFFHLVYFTFLMKEMPEDVGILGFVSLGLGVAGFAASHYYSYRQNAGQDFRHQKPNLGTLMFYPYLRIIPMHVCIGMGTTFEDMHLLIFLGLKTLADAGMHMVEHHLFQAPGKQRILRMED